MVLLRKALSEEEFRERRRFIRAEGELVCCYVLFHIYYTDQDHRKEPKRMADTKLRRLYRGETPLQEPTFLKHEIDRRSKELQVLLALKDKRRKLAPPLKEKNSSYTYTRSFSGGGGDCEGAELAGCKVTLAWDQDEKACITLELNHDGALVLQRSANQMCPADEGLINPLVDILHLSPPCQPWSPAHTVNGKNDVENTLALFTPGMYLNKTRPRMCTIEQTFGLERRHHQYFAALINQIMSAGYNVRWTTVNFKDYGLASSRQRLIVFAAQ
jgi:DNA (cytosine-5)-methyltransferase 1